MSKCIDFLKCKNDMPNWASNLSNRWYNSANLLFLTNLNIIGYSLLLGIALNLYATIINIWQNTQEGGEYANVLRIIYHIKHLTFSSNSKSMNNYQEKTILISACKRINILTFIRIY